MGLRWWPALRSTRVHTLHSLAGFVQEALDRWWGPLMHFHGNPIPADTVSGNIVLVSAAAERVLGNLLPDFEHIYGDLDYGLRARMAGVPVLLASRPGGTCAANATTGSSLDPELSLFRRLALYRAETRKIHGRDWRRFVALHGGGAAAQLGHWLMPYLRLLLARPNRHAARIISGKDGA